MVKTKIFLSLFAFIAALLWPPIFHARELEAYDGDTLEVQAPKIWVKGIPIEIKIKVPPGAKASECSLLDGSGKARSFPCEPGKVTPVPEAVIGSSGTHAMTAAAGDMKAGFSVRVIHGLLTLLPPLIAIGLALAFRQVVAALWISIWVGALVLYDWSPFTAVARSIDHYIIGSMADSGNASMLVFIIFMGGLIGIIAKSGGIQGVVELIAKRATSAMRGQVAAFLMGMFIFFDDYANTIIVGTTMRPISDKLRISREKLSYIVDSTAAPVASIFPISTWIGYEVGLIDKALSSIGSGDSGYMMFIESILYRFYPIFALALVLMVALTGREIGPMLKAERRARREGKPLRDGAIPMSTMESERVNPPEGKPRRWYNALVPLLFVIGVTFYGLWVNGLAELGGGVAEVRANSSAYGPLWGPIYVLGQVFSAASPNVVLAWASLGGCILTVVLVVGQRILTMAEAMQAWLSGVESMVIAIVVLLMAWSLGSVCGDLHTAEYLTTSLAGTLSPHALPVLTFVLAGGISFATGTSYGTMAILMPLVIPIANRLCLDAGMGQADQHYILVGVVSSVLAGSVFGDHCSPISDTTIMSSMASGSDHVDHVRTQLPYAILAGLVGIVLGSLPAAFGVSPLVSITLGVAAMAGVLYLFGRKVDENDKTVAPASE